MRYLVWKAERWLDERAELALCYFGVIALCFVLILDFVNGGSIWSIN